MLSHLEVKLFRKDQEVQCVGGGVPLGGLEHFKSLGQAQPPLLPAASDRYKDIKVSATAPSTYLSASQSDDLTANPF